jgi:dTDP-4-dehydrorhamnose 3,5-epimerase
LEDDTEFLYKCDDLYDPQHDAGIVYNDPDIGIDWEDIMNTYNITGLIISNKDTQQQTFANYCQYPVFEYGKI